MSSLSIILWSIFGLTIFGSLIWFLFKVGVAEAVFEISEAIVDIISSLGDD